MTITGTIESIFLSYYLQVRTEVVNVKLNHSWNLILLVSKQQKYQLSRLSNTGSEYQFSRHVRHGQSILQAHK